jgi:hypothetical protein
MPVRSRSISGPGQQPTGEPLRRGGNAKDSMGTTDDLRRLKELPRGSSRRPVMELGGSIATATAAVSAAATATAAVSAAISTATAAALAPGLTRLGLVHGETTTLTVLIVQAIDRGLSIGVAVHLDETESFAAAGLTVLNHFGALNGTELSEPRLQVR